MLVKDCEVWIKKVDPIFLHPIFDNDKKVTEDVLSQLEEKHKTLVNCLYVCYRCGGNNICSAYKHVRSADERTSAFNECLDFHKKWRDEWNQMLTPSSHARCVLHLLFRYKKTFFSQKELVMFQIWEKVLWALMCQKRLGMLKTIMAEAQLKGIYLKPFMEWVVASVTARGLKISFSHQRKRCCTTRLWQSDTAHPIWECGIAGTKRRVSDPATKISRHHHPS